MSVVKKIQLYAMSDNDRMVFSSLLSLLSFKTAFTCQIVEGDGDIAVVDVDSDIGRTQADSLFGQVDLVIKISAQTTPNTTSSAGDCVVHKPLRSVDIIRVLELIEGRPSAHAEMTLSSDKSSAEQVQLYKLTRWPPKAVINDFAKGARLCAAFMSHELAVEKAATMVGVSAAQIELFLARCREYDCVATRLSQHSTIEHASASAKHASLFSKLRMKLGAR